MLTVTSAHGVGTFMAEAEVKPFMLGQRSCGAAGSTDKLASTIAGAGEPGGGTGRGDASAVNHRAGMDGPGWTGRDGRAGMDGPGWTGRDGRARMDGPGRTGQDGRARTDGPGRTGQDGRARTDGPGRTGQDGRARTDGPGWTGQDGDTDQRPARPDTPAPLCRCAPADERHNGAVRHRARSGGERKATPRTSNWTTSRQ